MTLRCWALAWRETSVASQHRARVGETIHKHISQLTLCCVCVCVQDVNEEVFYKVLNILVETWMILIITWSSSLIISKMHTIYSVKVWLSELVRWHVKYSLSARQCDTSPVWWRLLCGHSCMKTGKKQHLILSFLIKWKHLCFSFCATGVRFFQLCNIWFFIYLFPVLLLAPSYLLWTGRICCQGQLFLELRLGCQFWAHVERKKESRVFNVLVILPPQTHR